jgi:hypothetical protein
VSGGVRLSAAQQGRLLKRLRTICLSFPETSERPSHGESAFFFKEKRSFANTDTYHHGAEHYSAWIAAPLGAQDVLVRSDPKHYFVPPYVGYRGWVGCEYRPLHDTLSGLRWMERLALPATGA